MEDLNNLLETVGVSSLLNMLKTIETTEYETLNVKKQKIEFASGRLANIRT
ncbi:MAG: hypothetical protein LBG59_02590 [Candidatus Peribacteria bacterium]|nr:hypothetical protein [Candidatus Peribacteria bacterium]